jgi:signal transduction histidine kinase
MDPLTASVAFSLVQFCVAIIMTGIYFAAPRESCTRHWAASGLLVGIGVVVAILNVKAPNYFFLAVGNICLFAGTVSVWSGLRYFYKRQPSHWGWTLIALFSAGFLLLLASGAGFTARAHFVSACLLLMFLLLLREIQQGTRFATVKRPSFARGMAYAGLSILIISHVLRTIISLRNPAVFLPGTISGLGAMILYLIPMTGALLMYAALLLIYFERMKSELTDSLFIKQEALETQMRFMEMFSHEYRTPLAVIRTNLDILQTRDEAGQNHFAVNLAKMRRAIARLIEVTEISLVSERLDDSRFDVQRESIHLSRFLESVLEEAEVLWEAWRPELILADGPDIFVDGDRTLLKTAILNLIDNAIKYSSRNSPVHITFDFAFDITSTMENSAAVIAIRDEGHGIPEEELGSVFEKYFRGSGSANTSGSGIGLYLVQNIIRQHEGSLSLRNNADGNGATATITLPTQKTERVAHARKN